MGERREAGIPPGRERGPRGPAAGREGGARGGRAGGGAPPRARGGHAAPAHAAGRGWAVRAVCGHMACTLHGVIDPAFLPNTTSGTEDAMEPPVAERRTWPIEQVVDEYETYSAQAAEAFVSVQSPGIAETPLPMGD